MLEQIRRVHVKLHLPTLSEGEVLPLGILGPVMADAIDRRHKQHSDRKLSPKYIAVVDRLLGIAHHESEQISVAAAENASKIPREQATE